MKKGRNILQTLHFLLGWVILLPLRKKFAVGVRGWEGGRFVALPKATVNKQICSLSVALKFHCT